VLASVLAQGLHCTCRVQARAEIRCEFAGFQCLHLHCTVKCKLLARKHEYFQALSLQMQSASGVASVASSFSAVRGRPPANESGARFGS